MWITADRISIHPVSGIAGTAVLECCMSFNVAENDGRTAARGRISRCGRNGTPCAGILPTRSPTRASLLFAPTMYGIARVDVTGPPAAADVRVHGSGRGRKWNCETDLSAERAKARQDPWFSETDVDQGGAGRDSVAPPEGPATALGLIPAMSVVQSAGVGVERIQSQRTFDLFRTSGTIGASGPLRVKFVRQSSWSRAQVAYALGKKLGGAVVRNRLRRRLRAIVSNEGLGLSPGAYLVSAGPLATELSFDELRAAMSQAVRVATANRESDPTNGKMRGPDGNHAGG
jgi:ribonuclease P protein component